MKHLLAFFLMIFQVTVFSSDEVIFTPSDANDLFNAGEKEKSFKIDMELAKKGDDRSQYNIGRRYYEGIEGVVEQDLIEAYAWFKLSTMKSSNIFRKQGLKGSKARLTAEEIKIAEEKAKLYFEKYGTGDRSQKPIEFLTQDVEPAEEKECIKTGSRIRTKDCIESDGFHIVY